MPEGEHLAKGLVDLIKAITRSEISAREELNENLRDRVGRPWTDTEDKQLERELLAVATILAGIHRRNPGGIIARARTMMDHGGSLRRH